MAEPTSPLGPRYPSKAERRAEKRQRRAQQGAAPKAPLKRVRVVVPPEQRYDTVHDTQQDREAANARSLRRRRMEDNDMLAVSVFAEAEITRMTEPIADTAGVDRRYALGMTVSEELLRYVMRHHAPLLRYERTVLEEAIRQLGRENDGRYLQALQVMAQHIMACGPFPSDDQMRRARGQAHRIIAAHLGLKLRSAYRYVEQAAGRLKTLCRLERERRARELLELR